MNNQQSRKTFFSDLMTSLENAGKVKKMPPACLTSLSSNDYLGLSRHPRVIDASVNALRKYGTGATGSRYLSGNHPLNEELEDRISNFKSLGKGVGRIFSSGYHANLSVTSVFGAHAGTIYSDSENHASLIDGLRLVKKPVHVFPHGDWEWVGDHLKKTGAIQPMVVTESLFSMSGDFAPIPELYKIIREKKGLLVIDDAHATGTVGSKGRGGLDFFSLDFDADFMIVTGTFSKALGSLGGFAILGERARTILTSLARPLIYSTALPPAILAASCSSLDILENSNHLTETLQDLSKRWQKDLTGASSSSPIISLGGPLSTLRQKSSKLAEFGFSLPVLVHPTVPEGQERLRLSVNLSWASGTEEALRATFSDRMEVSR